MRGRLGGCAGVIAIGSLWAAALLPSHNFALGDEPAQATNEQPTQAQVDPRGQEIVQLLQQAKQLHDDGKLPEAISSFEKAITIYCQQYGSDDDVSAQLLEGLSSWHLEREDFSA